MGRGAKERERREEQHQRRMEKLARRTARREQLAAEKTNPPERTRPS